MDRGEEAEHNHHMEVATTVLEVMPNCQSPGGLGCGDTHRFRRLAPPGATAYEAG